MSNTDKINSLTDDIDFLKGFRDFREDTQPDPDLLKALNSAIDCMQKELEKLFKEGENVNGDASSRCAE